MLLNIKLLLQEVYFVKLRVARGGFAHVSSVVVPFPFQPDVSYVDVFSWLLVLLIF